MSLLIRDFVGVQTVRSDWYSPATWLLKGYYEMEMVLTDSVLIIERKLNIM